MAQECVNKYNDTEHSLKSFAPRYLLDDRDVTVLPNELK